MLGLGGKPVKRREFITLAPAQQPARCRLSRSPSAQREAQMLVRLSILGAFAAILMLPTTLSAQFNPGGAINPGGGINPGGAFNPGGGINPGGAINPGVGNPRGDINAGRPIPHGRPRTPDPPTPLRPPL